MKTNKGITLIALIITIIIMLILAAVAISMAVGENGVMERGEKANSALEQRNIEETIQTSYYYDKNNAGKLDYVETKNAIEQNLISAGYTDITLTGTGEGENETFPLTVTATGKTGTYSYKINENGKVEKEEVSADWLYLEYGGVEEMSGFLFYIGKSQKLSLTSDVVTAQVGTYEVVQINGEYGYQITKTDNTQKYNLNTISDEDTAELVYCVDNEMAQYFGLEVNNVTEIEVNNICMEPLHKNVPDTVHTLTFLDGVESIGENFASDKLTTINFPKSLKKLDCYAFWGAPMLEEVTIPAENIEEIHFGAFDGCTKLKTINFEGTVEKWNTITNDENLRNIAEGAVVKCTDGEIQQKNINY